MESSRGRKLISLTICKSSLANHSIDQESRGFFGRRIGRPLTPARKTLLSEVLPHYALPPLDETIVPTALFPDAKEIWMEIGFGDGEHLAALVHKNPDIGFIGIEPFINGMANFLSRIADLSNPALKVHMDDAIPVVRAMEAACVDRLYILNPDPWPKTRHHKRRIINQKNLDDFTRILKPGGLLIMATDVDDLAEWMVTHCANHPHLQWTATCADDWTTAPDWWALTTRYAKKGLEAGRRQSYLVFERLLES